jgi:hypothetical protein
MAADHSALYDSSYEIRGMLNDTKVFSLRPSGLVGNAAIATGTTTAPTTTPFATTVSVDYSIYTLGSSYYLLITPLASTAKKNTAGNNPLQFTTGPIPAAYRPSRNFYSIMVMENGISGSYCIGVFQLDTNGNINVYPMTNLFAVSAAGWLEDGASAGWANYGMIAFTPASKDT